MARTYKFKPTANKSQNRKKSEYLRTKKREKIQLRESVKEHYW